MKSLVGLIAMRKSAETAIQMVVIILVGVCPWFAATAQSAPPPSLEAQLTAQFKPVKMAGGSSRTTVREPGTVLVIQKNGIFGVPTGSLVGCESKYQDGTLQPPGNFCLGTVKNVARNFQIGEKVYPLKISLHPKNDKIVIRIVACDSCNGTDPPTAFWSQVIFQFPKGYLETAAVPDIEDTIAQVLAVDNGNSEQAAPVAQSGQEQSVNQQPATEPVSIQTGQTMEQVQSALGQPEKIVNLGAKQIYVYKDLKITFMNGKVSDVQ